MEEHKMTGFYNKIFDNLDTLEKHLLNELYRFENDVDTVKSITSWEWIINAILT